MAAESLSAAADFTKIWTFYKSRTKRRSIPCLLTTVSPQMLTLQGFTQCCKGFCVNLRLLKSCPCFLWGFGSDSHSLWSTGVALCATGLWFQSDRLSNGTQTFSVSRWTLNILQGGVGLTSTANLSEESLVSNTHFRMKGVSTLGNKCSSGDKVELSTVLVGPLHVSREGVTFVQWNRKWTKIYFQEEGSHRKLSLWEWLYWQISFGFVVNV